MNDATLISAALKLPARKREKVAEALLASIKFPSKRHLDRVWGQEAEARIDALKAGKMRTIAGEKVLHYRAKK